MNTTATSCFSSSEHSWFGSRRGSLESILSVQGKETDFVRDTTDTEACSDDEGDLEYEPVSEPEDQGPFEDDTSGESDKEIISTKVIEVTVGDDGDLVFADSEQTDSDGSDSEIDLNDYWQCAQCRNKNNNPLYQYCEKCFKVRKNFFPPRPKPKTSKPKTETSATLTVHQLAYNTDSGIDSASASQELSQATSPGESDTFSQVETLSQTDTLSQVETITTLETSQNETAHPSSLNKLALSNVILARSYLKRRAESADRDRKRVRKDFSDSDSDSSDNDRRRKSKSLGPEVKPLVKTISDPSLTIESMKDSTNDNVCIICSVEPKSGVFVHGRIAHICCCYKCAMKVWSKSKRCPVCNCKVSNVLKAVVM